MLRVKDRNTGPERRLRRALWAAGLRYRLRYKLPGKPDLVFPTRRLAIFVDGCFWHGCPLHATYPKANQQFWRDKLAETIRRDQRVNATLREQSWQVLRFWEHEVEHELDRVVARIGDCVKVNRTEVAGNTGKAR
jgi:DNA mismatch endonuclease (patch repair protein)